MNKQLIIGLGSGRCGTVSLRDLLIYQGVDATHEITLMPWECNYDLCNNVIEKVLNRNSHMVSDIGYYYLPYITYLIKRQPLIKCICLKREQAEVVRSFLNFSRYNYWSKPFNREETKWDATFPTYDNKSKSDGISLYWEEYYRTIESLANKFPDNIQIFDINETFNEEAGQKKLFKFLNIEGRIKLGIKRHKKEYLK